MKIYEFPLKQYIQQPIDLNYIVSIGPVIPMHYDSYIFGERYCYFDIYIKLGQPFRITYYSGSYDSKCPQETIGNLETERLKLIEEWKAFRNEQE